MAGTPETIGQRVTSLREARKIKSAGELARLLGTVGFEVSRQAVHALERGAVDSPRKGLIEALAKVLDTSPEFLLYGPREWEDSFVVELTGLAPDLTSVQRDQLLWLANDMAKETRARRLDELSEEEVEWVRLLRAQSPALRDRLLEEAREVAEPPAHQGAQRQAGQPRRGRSA